MKTLAFTLTAVCYAFIFAFSQPTIVTITGQVTDDVSGAPIENITVNIITDTTSPPFLFNYSNSTNTNANGNYTFTISVPNPADTVVFFSVYISGGCTYHAYYGHIVRTDSLPMTASFNICNPFLHFGIRGLVFAGVDTAKEGEVNLIEFDRTDSTLASIQGGCCWWPNSANPYVFQFDNIYTGSYLIKIALNSNDANYADYMPTYYGDVLFWATAASLQLNSDTLLNDINLIQGNNPGGPGFIGGNVSQGANKVSGQGDPLSNVPVLLLDISNNPVAYTYSDITGYFAFSNIAYGTYNIYVEVTGKYTNPGIVTIDATNPSVTNVQVEVNNTDVTTSIGNSTSETFSNIITIYPNPVSNNVQIEINSNTSTDLNFTIYNSLGEKVFNNNYQVTDNIKNTFDLNVSSLPKGLYTLKINSLDGRVSGIRKFVKI